jgi:transcriptional regulator with XRE-family HTH domain
MRQNQMNYQIGRKIALRRKMVGLSRRELSLMSQIDLQQLTRYEAGIDYIKSTSLLRIAKSLRVEPDYFFTVNNTNKTS